MTVFFAGLWPIIAKFGIAGTAVAGLLAFAWFSPLFKKTALTIAACLICTTAAYTIGVHDEYKRGLAQWNAAIDAEQAAGEKIRANAERDVRPEPPSGLQDDRWNRDSKAP